MRGLKSMPTTSSAPWFQSDSVSRPAGALQVDGATAAAVEVADQLRLDTEEVGPAGPDQLDGFVEPALVALGGLVPGGPVRGVHAADVREFLGRRRPDQGWVIRHPRSLASGGDRMRPGAAGR